MFMQKKKLNIYSQAISTITGNFQGYNLSVT